MILQCLTTEMFDFKIIPGFLSPGLGFSVELLYELLNRENESFQISRRIFSRKTFSYAGWTLGFWGPPRWNAFLFLSSLHSSSLNYLSKTSQCVLVARAKLLWVYPKHRPQMHLYLKWLRLVSLVVSRIMSILLNPGLSILSPTFPLEINYYFIICKSIIPNYCWEVFVRGNHELVRFAIMEKNILKATNWPLACFDTAADSALHI